MTAYVVPSGVTISGLTLHPGDTLTVMSGGTAEDTAIGDGATEYVESSGLSFADTVLSGGDLVVSLGGTALSLTVSSGGTASGAGVLTGEATNSGSVSDLQLSGVLDNYGHGDGLLIANGGVEYVESGAEASLTAVANGGAEYVLDKGSDFGAVVSSGGSFTVSAGAAASGTTVLSGGQDIILNGGAATDVAVSSGGTIVAGGALTYVGAATLALGGKISGNGVITQNGPGILVISATTANPADAPELVISGGVAALEASGALGASMAVFAPAAGQTAQLRIGAADRPTNGALLANALEDFESGSDSLDLSSLAFTPGATAVTSDGVLTITDGATTFGFTLSGAATHSFQVESDNVGGTLILPVAGGGLAYVVGPGVTSNGLDLEPGDTLTVLSGGRAQDTMIGNGATEYVSSNGLSVQDSVLSGGSMVISSGATASSLSVSSGGTVAGQGTLTAMTNNSGTVSGLDAAGTVDDFGHDDNISISNGGVELVEAGGSTSGSILSAGAAQSVQNGGTAFSVTVNGDAGETVSSGGTVTGLTVQSGGQAIIAADAAAFDVSVLGGTLMDDGAVIDNGATPTTLSGFLTGVGAFTESGAGGLGIPQGTTTDALVLSGGVTLVNASTVSQTGIVAFGMGAIINQAGATWNLANGLALASGGSGAFSNAGVFTKTDSAPLNHVSVDFTSTGTVSIASGSLDFLSATDRFGGTVTGAGTLVLGALTGTSGVTLAAGLRLSIAALNIAGAETTVTLAGAQTYGGQFAFSGGVLALSGFALTLSGSSSLGSTSETGPTPELEGSGDLTTSGDLSIVNGLTLGGGVLFKNSGTVTQSGVVTSANGVITNLAGATWNLANGITLSPGGAGSYTNMGTLAKTGTGSLYHVGVDFTNSGVIAVATGSLDFLGPINSLAGKIGGAGTFVLGTPTSTSTTTLAAGLQLTVGHLEIEGVANAVKLGGNLTYAGVFDLNGGTLDLKGFALNLTGAATLGPSLAAGAAPVISGGGTLTLTGATSILSRLSLTGGLILKNAGKVTQSGLITITSATIDNEKGAVVDLTSNNGMALSAGGKGALNNSGTVEKTGGTGIAVVGVAVTNSGTIEVTAGTFEFLGAVAGAGTVEIKGGTADFASSFSGAVVFSGSTGVLELAKSRTYVGTVTGLSKTGSDSLDLADIAFTSGVTKATFAGSAVDGVLTVTDGIHSSKIRLIGDYVGSTFKVSSDGHGGTKVVDPGASVSATPSRFAATMAAFGAGPAHGPSAAPPEVWRRAEPVLASGRDQGG